METVPNWREKRAGRAPVVFSRRSLEKHEEGILRRPLMMLPVAAAALYFVPSVGQREIKFFTDFNEKDPLRFWRRFEEGDLNLEPFAGRMSALAWGANLLKPSMEMSDGRARFHFVAPGRSAAFMIRGQSHNDCYLVSLRRNIVDGTPRLTFRVDKRRKGYTKPLTGIAIEDFQIATPVKQRMAIEMDGKNFAARLEWTERNQLGWEQTESRVIHTWKDDSYRQGAVGLYGPQRPRNGGDGEFRIFSVQVEG